MKVLCVLFFLLFPYYYGGDDDGDDDRGEVGKYFSPWVKEEIRKVIGNE